MKGDRKERSVQNVKNGREKKRKKVIESDKKRYNGSRMKDKGREGKKSKKRNMKRVKNRESRMEVEDIQRKIKE